MSDKARFIEKLKKADSGCWVWQAAYDAAGYGRFWLRKRMQPASRAAYMLFVGEIPAGLSVLHSCNNKACCNPEHLRLGTQAENMADLAVAGNNPLKKVDALIALQMRNSGKSFQFIADHFNSSKQAVFNILRRTYGKP